MQARKSSKIMMATVLTLLQKGTVTSRALARACEIHITTAQSWLKAMREAGTIHVVDWEKDASGRDCAPVYALGDGVSVQRRALSRAEIAKRYRQRKKADGKDAE